jgi:HD-GYP domain-containing protein (c-di-GMP phosphodiesterase class II)
MPSLRPSGTTAIPAASRLEEKAQKMEKGETPPPLQQARTPVQETPRQIREEAPRPQETAKQEPQNQPPREELEARLLLPPRADTLRGRAGMTAPASTGSGIDETPRKEAPEKAVDSGSSPGILTRRDIHRLFYSVAGNEIQPAQENKASGRPPVKDELRRTEQQAFVSSAIQHHEEARTKPDLHLPMLSQAAAEFVPRDVRKKEEKGSEPPVAEAAGGDSGDASAAKIDSSGPFSDITSSRKATTRETQDAVQVSFQAGKEPVTEAGKTGSVHLAAHEEESPRPSLSISSGDNPPPPIVQASFVRKSRVAPEPPADESRTGGEAARAHVLQAGQKEPVRTGSRDFRYVSFSVGEMDTLSEKIASRSSARTIDFSQSRSLIVEVSRTSETPADEKGGQGGFGQGSGRERPYDFKSEYILNQLRKQQMGDNRGRNILETAKEATIQKCMEDALQIEYFSRMAPLKHSQQASRMATTCIEVIIRKSYRDDVTGERSAAKMLALLLKSNSDYTFEHSARVMDLSVSLAAEMGIRDENELRAIEEGALLHDIGETQVAVSRSSPEEQDRLALFLEDVDLARCSEFHDIGKVKIPAEILNKTGPLTREEQIILKQHPVIGEEMLRPIPSMRPILSTVRGHHERWDGDGYPDGLKGEDIPLAARIISITDTWDAMISDRPYHKAVPLNLAARELRKGAGSQFDPELVDRFLALVEKRVSS